MKKIVFLHPSHWEQNMGGAEIQISFLVKYLSENGYEIHYIYENKGSKVVNKENVILHPLKKINIKKLLGQRWFLYTHQVKRKLISIEPDVIYTRFFSSWSGIAAIYAKENRVKHIWAISSDKNLKQNLNIRLLIKPFDIIELKAVRDAFKYATKIITQNNYQTTELFKKYNRVGVKILQMGELEDPIRIEKPKNSINIVWIANLKPIKKPEYYLNLVNELSSLSNSNFLMVGKPNDKYNKIIEKLSKKVNSFKFMGELSNIKVNEILCKSHILINTSNVEGFSNTFIQAWMRKVVVLTMNSNPDNILTEQNIGFVCPSLHHLKEKTKLLIQNIELRDTMANKAFSYARENHSLDYNIPKILKIIN